VALDDLEVIEKLVDAGAERLEGRRTHSIRWCQRIRQCASGARRQPGLSAGPTARSDPA